MHDDPKSRDATVGRQDPGGPPRVSPRGPGRWGLAVVVVALLAGGGWFVSQLRSEAPSPAPAPPVALDPGAAVDSAHGSAPVDSIVLAADLPGFETEHLTDGQRLWLYHRAHLEGCTCGCGMTMAQCRVEDPTCPVSPGRAVEMVAEAERQPL